jgi:hypothetical protein
VDFNEDRGLFRTFANSFEMSCEDSKPTLQLLLIDLHCSDEVRSKFKEGDLHNFCKCLRKDKYLNLLQNTPLYARLFGSTDKCEQAFLLMKLNESTHWNWLTDENITSTSAQESCLASTVQAHWSH